MTDLLIKLFVTSKLDKKYTEEEIKQNALIREKYASLASITGIVINVLLSITKLFAGIFTSSISIISDALNNITDIGSSLITLIGFKLSKKKSDREHPWGHGRIEYLTGFIVDMIIIYVGLELFKTSVDKIIHPTVPSINTVTLVLLVLAILAKLWLFIFYKKIGKKIDSAAMDGVAYDSISDTISTTAVLISALVAMFANFSIDGIVSLIVSIFILITGFKAIKEMIDMLIGTGPDEEFIKNIRDFVKDYHEIAGIHDIMVHDYGPGRKIVSFHAEVPADSDICAIHDVIDKLEGDIFNKFNCITTIHMDPIVVNDEKIKNTKNKVLEIVKSINPRYSIHDFRMTDGGSIVNVIFDLSVPFGEDVDFKELENTVKEKIKELGSEYNAVINVENTL